MRLLPASLNRSSLLGLALCGLAIGLPGVANAAPTTPLQQPPPACVVPTNGTPLIIATSNGSPQIAPVCTPQPGQIVVVLVEADPNANAALVNNTAPAGPTTNPNTTTTTTLNTVQPAAQTDNMPAGMTDPRIDTYAKRQAIRDLYRGRIDVTTFNDELGDGVDLNQALADAMAALQNPAPQPPATPQGGHHT
jgi:hypothetical protein